MFIIKNGLALGCLWTNRIKRVSAKTIVALVHLSNINETAVDDLVESPVIPGSPCVKRREKPTRENTINAQMQLSSRITDGLEGETTDIAFGLLIFSFFPILLPIR